MPQHTSLAPRRGRLEAVAALALLVMFAAGCGGEQQFGQPPEDYYGDGGTEVSVSDPIEFTDQPYENLSGESTIQEVRDLVPGPNDATVWYGFSSPYPVEGDCNPEFENGETVPEVIEEFPTTIEGVVTLHPRYFQNVTVCGTRQRYQGTYFLQDESTGIHILKDSRVADADIGDRVELRVLGVVRYFDTIAVLAFDQEEKVNEPGDETPVYYEEIERPFDQSQDLYEVRRIRGEVTVEPTNENFNEMVVQSMEDPEVEWYVSMGREIGRRDVGPDKGDVVELTGPVHNSFGLRMVVNSLGQMNFVNE